MASPRAILFVDTCPNSQSAFFLIFAAAGYVVITAQSAEEAVTLSLEPSIDAIVINGSRCQGGISLAEKLKFLSPDLPVVLICAASQMNDPLPPWVDAGTCSDTPEAAVLAVTTFLSAKFYGVTTASA